MNQNEINLIKRLRDETGMGLVEAKRAIIETNFDYEKAYQLLMERGNNRIKPNRQPLFGRIETYNHGGRIGVVVEVNCETDFVARTDGFITLCHEIALQIAASNPVDVVVLMGLDYVRDANKSVSELVNDYAIKCGENIVINRFSRFEISDAEGDLAQLEKPKPTMPDAAELACSL